MSKTKVSIGVIAVTLLTVATLFLLPLPPRTEVKTAMVTRGEMLETLLLEGVVTYQDDQPLVSLGPGQIRQVYVRQGDRVEAGQLLFSLDTAEEEAAMTLLSQELSRLEGLDGTMQALMTRQRLELCSQQAALKGSIAMKQVRAQQDGVMGPICCREGELVLEGTVLGSMHGENLCVMAFARAEAVQGIEDGAAAFLLDESGRRIGGAVLMRMGQPQQDSLTGAAGYPLWFSLGEELPLGQRLTVELVKKRFQNQTLAPMEAVGSDGCLWVVEEGVARPVQVEVLRQDGDFVSVDDDLEGMRVILEPDRQKLSPGRAVREGEP